MPKREHQDFLPATEWTAGPLTYIQGSIHESRTGTDAHCPLDVGELNSQEDLTEWLRSEVR